MIIRPCGVEGADENSFGGKYFIFKKFGGTRKSRLTASANKMMASGNVECCTFKWPANKRWHKRVEKGGRIYSRRANCGFLNTVYHLRILWEIFHQLREKDTR